MTRLRDLLRSGAFLPAGPCASCGSPRAAPLCAACLAGSAVSSRPAVALLGPHALHFVGAYHACLPDGGPALSPLGRCLRAFKDHGDRYAGRCLGSLFAQRCAALVTSRHAVIPVPSDHARLRDRGLSPAAWLAGSLCRQSGARLCTTALRRLPGRPPQRGLGGAARRANARDAFVLGPCSVRGYSVLLVDDVVTTGATLGDAIRCLRAAGSVDIVCLALACADQKVIQRCRSRTDSAGTSAIASRPD